MARHGPASYLPPAPGRGRALCGGATTWTPRIPEEFWSSLRDHIGNTMPPRDPDEDDEDDEDDQEDDEPPVVREPDEN